MKNQVKKIRDWTNKNDDRKGISGKIVKSNITDNESAKMKTSNGVIQGYMKKVIIITLLLIIPLVFGTLNFSEKDENGKLVFEKFERVITNLPLPSENIWLGEGSAQIYIIIGKDKRLESFFYEIYYHRNH